MASGVKFDSANIKKETAGSSESDKKYEEAYMKADLNLVILSGRLTQNAELITTSSQVEYVRFSFGNNYEKKTGEQYIDDVNYFTSVLWGEYGKALLPYLTKGQQIEVVGKLNQNRYEKGGKKYSVNQIIAKEVHLVGGKKSESGNTGNSTDSEIPETSQTDEIIPEADVNYEIF